MLYTPVSMTSIWDWPRTCATRPRLFKFERRKHVKNMVLAPSHVKPVRRAAQVGATPQCAVSAQSFQESSATATAGLGFDRSATPSALTTPTLAVTRRSSKSLTITFRTRPVCVALCMQVAVLSESMPPTSCRPPCTLCREWCDFT